MDSSTVLHFQHFKPRRDLAQRLSEEHGDATTPALAQAPAQAPAQELTENGIRFSFKF